MSSKMITFNSCFRHSEIILTNYTWIIQPQLEGEVVRASEKQSTSWDGLPAQLLRRWDKFISGYWILLSQFYGQMLLPTSVIPAQHCQIELEISEIEALELKLLNSDRLISDMVLRNNTPTDMLTRYSLKDSCLKYSDHYLKCLGNLKYTWNSCKV